jgi:diguanylate cyclase (GGDEF)-like protein
MALGLAAFVATALLAGAMWEIHTRKLKRVSAQSVTDRLTGLRNYAYLEDALRRESRRVERYGGAMSLVLLDLDRFKEFNDRHGHETGNSVLRRVGATLRSAVRDADMAARYGGEEFAVLIRGDETHGYELAERLRRAIETTAIEVRGGGEVFCTVSAGVATYPLCAVDETELVERADDALYESKRRGRNRVTIYAGVAAQSELPASLSA